MPERNWKSTYNVRRRTGDAASMSSRASSVVEELLSGTSSTPSYGDSSWLTSSTAGASKATGTSSSFASAGTYDFAFAHTPSGSSSSSSSGRMKGGVGGGNHRLKATSTSTLLESVEERRDSEVDALLGSHDGDADEDGNVSVSFLNRFLSEDGEGVFDDDDNDDNDDDDHDSLRDGKEDRRSWYRRLRSPQKVPSWHEVRRRWTELKKRWERAQGTVPAATTAFLLRVGNVVVPPRRREGLVRLWEDRETKHRRLWTVLRVLWFLCLVTTLLTSLRLATTPTNNFYNSEYNNNGSAAHNLKAKLLRPRGARRRSSPDSSSTPIYTNSHHTTSLRHIGARIPPPFLNLLEIQDVVGPRVRGDGDHADDVEGSIPFIWHVPRTGGTTIHAILSSCMGLTLASDVGGRGGRDKESTLQVVTSDSVTSLTSTGQKTTYWNVDLSTPEGIQRAVSLDLVAAKPDAVFSSLIYEASLLFNPRHRGRLFAMFRDPVERAVSLFYHTQDLVWRRGNVVDLMDISISEYFKSGMGENNWMTRFLADARRKPLTEEDLDVAMEVLRRKVLIGLLSEKAETFSRLLRFYGWADTHMVNSDSRDCAARKLDWNWPLKHKHPTLEEHTDHEELRERIVAMNTYDLRLYEYAQQLFREQARLFQ